jgi:hypothetical protein
VFKIQDFAEKAGVLDRTDPYVSLLLGSELLKTSTKNNAGGSVAFNESLSFSKKPLLQGNLKVKVMDSDS